jgi:hypothetical protein
VIVGQEPPIFYDEDGCEIEGNPLDLDRAA